MATTRDVIETMKQAIEDHPLVCSECGSWKHASEMICEQCRIDITVENTSTL